MPRSSTLHGNSLRRSAPRAGLSAALPLSSAIAATAELCGHAISDAAATLLANDLAEFHQPAVMTALARCRSELRGTLNIGEILARLNDGRPGAKEAWDMLPKNEAASVVWTREMAQAWGDAAPLMEEGNPAAAYRVFHDSYTQAVLMARCRREAIQWMASLGTDPVHREQVLREAVKEERLPASYVEELLPYRSLTPQARHMLAKVRIKKFT